MIHPIQSSATSRPRILRGLALLLWVGVVGLLVTLGLRDLPKNDSSGTIVGQSVSSPASRAVLLPTERELAWKRILAEIESAANDDQREQILESAVERIKMSDIPAALDELRKVGFGESEISQRLIRRWAQADGSAAAAWAEQLPEGSVRENALSAVAIEWANTDLNSAAAWARQMPEAAEKRLLLLAISNEAVTSDPVEALRLAAELPADAARDEVIRRSAAEWALMDSSSAVDWAKEIRDKSLRAQVLAGVITAWSESAPESAATLAIQALPAGRLLDDTVISLVQRWAQKQPVAAAAWVELFPEGELRNSAIESLLCQWSQSDADGAQHWRAAHL